MNTNENDEPKVGTIITKWGEEWFIADGRPIIKSVLYTKKYKGFSIRVHRGTETKEIWYINSYRLGSDELDKLLLLKYDLYTILQDDSNHSWKESVEDMIKRIKSNIDRYNKEREAIITDVFGRNVYGCEEDD